MPLPDGSADLLLAEDLKYRTKDLLIESFPFSVVAPQAGLLLYQVVFDKTTVIERVSLSLAVLSKPATGVSKLWLSKKNIGADLSAGVRVDGRILAHIQETDGANEKTERFFPSVIYFDQGESLYILLDSSHPAAIPVQGVVTLYSFPTYRS